MIFFHNYGKHAKGDIDQQKSEKQVSSIYHVTTGDMSSIRANLIIIIKASRENEFKETPRNV